jgi:hypothetical protein
MIEDSLSSPSFPLHLHRKLLQTLIPLYNTPHQERPTPPERTQTRLPLRPAPLIVPESRTDREPHTTYQIEKSNPPAQRLGCRLPPLGLRLEHEERAGNDKSEAAEHLGSPVEDYGDGARHVVVDTWESGQAGDPEYCSADELGEGSEETQGVEVVCSQVIVGGPPDP